MPVNSYRWIRGFNEYDNWQASGVSGQGARSFYYPPKPQQCADCHMPLEPSKDAGNVNGLFTRIAFPGANTAVPNANQDQATGVDAKVPESNCNGRYLRHVACARMLPRA